MSLIPAWQERRDSYMWTLRRCWERQTHPRRCAGTNDPIKARRADFDSEYWAPQSGRTP